MVIIAVDHRMSVAAWDMQLESKSIDALEGNSSSPAQRMITMGILGNGHSVIDASPK